MVLFYYALIMFPISIYTVLGLVHHSCVMGPQLTYVYRCIGCVCVKLCECMLCVMFYWSWEISHLCFILWA